MLTRKGRRRIYTDETEINIDNVKAIVMDAVTTHDANVVDIKLLYDIEKNIQELSRAKEVRPEIDIKATDPIASQIVDFKLGYEHGNPIVYMQRANVDSGNKKNDEDITRTDDIRIATLNEMMRECKKASKDCKMARDIKICGLGYRYVAPKKVARGISPFEIYTLNPTRTFVIYSNDVYCEPVAAVTFTQNKLTQIRKFGVWTNDKYFEFDSSDNSPVKESTNYIGYIPIIEYINNHDIMGSFEKELELIDAYNIVTSDRVNDVSQQVQSILWLHNTELDKENKEKLAEGGVIQTKANADGKDAKIEYVNAPLRQADIQTLATSLKERILEGAGVPKLAQNGQNSTGEAQRVVNGWHIAEQQAKTSELTWRDSEDNTLLVCLAIVDAADSDVNGVSTLKLSDIDYDMHRSENYDLVSRVNALVTLTNAGYDVEKSVAICKIGDDPLQFALDSKENVDKLRFGKSEESLKTEESIQPDTVKF